jgi:hypothetical protein
MKNQRSISTLAASLAFCALASIGTAARADQVEDVNGFAAMLTLAKVDGMMDGKKDGMVSKAEYLAMMSKVWDMKAKEMQLKGDKMSADEFMRFGKFFSRGEKN